MKILSRIIIILFSPTRLVIDRLKDHRTNAQSKAALLLKWNRDFFRYDLFVAIVLGVVSLGYPQACDLPSALCWGVFIVAFSRCNETVCALLHDVGRELDLAESSTALTTGQRIKMAMRTYVGLFINFGVIYYLLPKLFSVKAFDPPLGNFVDALYFSGITIATVGYGDIKPDSAAIKMLVLYELFSGLLLVVVALSVYLAAHSGQRKKQ